MPNSNSKNRTLVSTFKKGTLLAVISTAMLITLMISSLELIDFSKHKKKLEADYLSEKKEIIKQEVLRVIDYIARNRNLTQQKIKARIKKRTYEAHKIATNIYNQFNGKLSEQRIKKLIIEALRPARFFNNTGYYFIHSLDGVLQLHARLPQLEGKNRLNLTDSTGKSIVKNLFKIIRENGEGFTSTYMYSAFDKSKKDKTKFTFVKHFKPYDWSISTGDYLENIEQDIQQEMLEHIEHIKFGENSYIFVVDYNGKTLMHPSQKYLIGENISNLKDPNGVNLFQEQRKAVENPEGDYIYYSWNKPSTSSPSPKITFIKGIPDWQWMIGTGLYIDDIKDTTLQLQHKLKTELIKQTIYIFFIVVLSSLFIIHISNKFTQRVTGELGMFLAFFTTVSEKAKKINTESLQFIEFKELATSANRMLNKKIETEESLRTSEENLKASQRITHFGSWEFNIKENNLHWSDEVFRIFELDPDKTQPSYEAYINQIHPDDKDAVHKAYQDAIIKKIPFDIEHRILLNNGKIKYVREHTETYYDDNGEAISSSGTVQDITEIKEKEDQLRRTQKMDALGKLTGGIAHDYNNMMGVILGYSDLLLSHANNHEKVIKYVEQIRNAGERARDLTDKLMAFSRYKPSETEVVNISEQLQNQQNLFDKILTARIKLDLKLDNNLWPTKIDLGDFNDAIINIVINSSHAIESNGTLHISTYNEHLDRHYAGMLELPDGDYVVVSLTDSGTGMDEQTISKIFDPFFSTKGDQGTGLGLSQVYGFTKRSGGAIKVKSAPDKGTKFKLYFPRHNVISSASVIEHTRNIAASETGHETILIVDDEEPLCAMADEILTAQGYHVLQAFSAKQALEILQSEPVDMVFSDIIMPEMTGYELADEISKKYPNIIIQLTSGYNDVKKFNIDLNIDISNMYILSKPYSRSELLKCIRNALDTNLLSQAK